MNIEHQPAAVNRRLILATLMLASMAAVMSTDMYAPSLAALPGILGTTASKVQLTMAINALFFGLAQLIHGPLSDRFGRRPVLLWGVGLFVLFSILCGMAQTVEQLIVARALQGTAASVEAVLMLAIIGDTFAPEDRPKAFALYGAVWSVAPALAPVIGGHVHEIAGWNWNFYIVAGMGIIAFIMSFLLLPETGQPDNNALNPRTIASNYKKLIAHSGFIGLTMLMSLPLAGIMVYITASPFVFKEHFDFSTSRIGYYQAALVVAYMIASAITSVFASRVSHITLLKAGISFVLIGLISTTFMLLAGTLSSNGILFCMLIFALGFGPLFSVTPGMIMETAPTSRGTAAAMLGTMEMLVIGISISLLSRFTDDVAAAMAYTFAVITICIIIVGLTRPWGKGAEL